MASSGSFLATPMGIFLIIFIIAGVGVGVYFAVSGSSSVTSGTSTTTNTLNIGRNFRVTYYNTEASNIEGEYGAHLEAALSFWEDKLLEDTVIDLDVSTVALENRLILAYGSMNDSSNIRAGGDITINSNARAQSWTDVIKHEIGHVMGIGIADKWRSSVIGSNTIYYLSSIEFPETYQIYQNDYNGTEEHIPLGDVSGHFDEAVFTTELMTPYSNEGLRQPITDLTLTALATLGWNVDMSKAEERN